jgi:hypothetical protein
MLCDRDVTLRNSVASNIKKWRTFRLLRWMQNLYQSTWDHEIVYAERPSNDGQV